MRFWRLARKPFVALDGAGARLYGGRWNRKGLAVVYCSEHLSLAALEVIVHLELGPEFFPRDYMKRPIDVPDELTLERIEPVPPTDEEAEALGSRWCELGKTAGLLVPSSVIPEERNLLLNPRHRDFASVNSGEPKPFRFDRRLFRR